MKEEKQTHLQKLKEIEGIDEAERLLLEFYELIKKKDDKRGTSTNNCCGGVCRTLKRDI